MHLIHRRFVPAVLCALLLTLAGCADPGSGGVSDRIDAVLEAAVDQGQIGGAAVVVLRGDTPVHARGYGFADIAQRTPAEVETFFNLGSVTKIFTGAGLVALAETGALDLDDRLQEWLPEFPNPDQGARITLRQLVNHTSGLSDYLAADLVRWEATGTPMTTAFVLDYLRDRPLDFEPGAHWSYTNTGFYLAGLIFERASGTPWAAYLRDAVLDPLGLHDIRLCDEVRAIASAGYERGDAGLAPAPLYLVAGLRGDGGLCATAGDLARALRLIETGHLFPAEAFDTMRAPTRLTTHVDVDYGLGVRLGWLQGRRMWGHTGGHAGTVAAVARYPDEDVTIAVLINTIRSDRDALTLIGEVATPVFGLDTAPPTGASAGPDALAVYAGRYRGGRGSPLYDVAVASGQVTITRVGGDRSHTLHYLGDHTFSRVGGAYPLDRYVFQMHDGVAQAYSDYYNGFHGAFQQRIDP